MNKKEDLEIRKAPEELTEQDLEKVNGGFECPIYVEYEIIDPNILCVNEDTGCPSIMYGCWTE